MFRFSFNIFGNKMLRNNIIKKTNTGCRLAIAETMAIFANESALKKDNRASIWIIWTIRILKSVFFSFGIFFLAVFENIDPRTTMFVIIVNIMKTSQKDKSESKYLLPTSARAIIKAYINIIHKNLDILNTILPFSNESR